MAGDPLAGDRGRGHRRGRRAGGGVRRLRRRPRGAGQPARRRHGGGPRQPAGGGVRGPAPLRRPHRAQQDRHDGRGRPRAVHAEMERSFPGPSRSSRPPMAGSIRAAARAPGRGRGRPRRAALASRRGRGPRPRRFRDRGAPGPHRDHRRRPRRPRREGGGDRGGPSDQGLLRRRGQADAPRGAGRRPPRRPSFRPALGRERSARRQAHGDRPQGLRSGRGSEALAGWGNRPTAIHSAFSRQPQITGCWTTARAR